MVDPAQQQVDETELEIAAFQGPHIKRARIVLVLVGILYCIVGYMNYGDIAELKRMTEAFGASDEAKSAVNLAYGIVIFLMIAGVVNIVLALLGGQHPVGAMYIAMGIFAIHTGLQLYAGALPFTNLFWWLTAICLGMGFQAAMKMQALRKERRGGL